MERVLIIGGGSLGLVFGGLLSGGGEEVTFVIEDDYYRNTLRQKGLYFFGSGFDSTYEVKTVPDFRHLEGAYDLLIFDSTRLDTVHDISFLFDHLETDSVILCCQDGIVEDIIEDIAGSHTIASLLPGLECYLHAPGNVEIRKYDVSYIGLWHGDEYRLLKIYQLLEKYLPMRLEADILSRSYSKLIFEACVGAICAISGMHIGAMLRKHRIRSLIIGVMSEAIQVADASGIRVQPYSRFFDYYSYLRGDNKFARFNRHAVLWFFSFFFEEKISRQLKAIVSNQPSSVDAINGYISRMAARSDVITPLNDLLISMVREIENHRRQIGIENFEEEFFYFYG